VLGWCGERPFHIGAVDNAKHSVISESNAALLEDGYYAFRNPVTQI
jgi:hypothetical protein